MSTPQQIEANRLNAQRSTGPRSAEGKAAVRFNALKSGIDAQSQVIPGEDPAALAALAAEYHDRYPPATPEVRALVDTLITAEWMQRRFRNLEPKLLQVDILMIYPRLEGLQVPQAYDHGSDTYDRLQRRINAVERTFHRAPQLVAAPAAPVLAIGLLRSRGVRDSLDRPESCPCGSGGRPLGTE